MTEGSGSDSTRRTVDWNDADGGFAYVRNEVIIPVGDLPSAAHGDTAELRKALRALLTHEAGGTAEQPEVLADSERERESPPTTSVEAAAPTPSTAALEAAINYLDAPAPTPEARATSLVEEYGVKGVTTELTGNGRFVIVRGEFDAIAIISALRARNIAAQPNHAFWLHDECCCALHPATPWAAGALLPMLAGAIGGHPRSGIKGSPRSGIKGSPRSGIKGSPRSGIKGSGSSAEPLTQAPADLKLEPLPWTTPSSKVVILDTGVPKPSFLATTSGVPSDEGDNTSQFMTASNTPVGAKDDFLDEAGGHGGFIASIIERFAPGTSMTLWNVLDTWMNELVDEVTLCNKIDDAVGLLKDNAAKGIISISLGGPVWHEAGRLADAIAAAQLAGVVIVASAGNDATCTPQYPAALPGVVSVGAIGPDGPADFTNYGPWVRCCAPGVDVVGRFFHHDFKAAPDKSGDPDKFEGWAMWSGTSFAVPAVVAALLRHMAHNNHTAQQAVEAVIDAPHLGRIPGLGTVVNI